MHTIPITVLIRCVVASAIGALLLSCAPSITTTGAPQLPSGEAKIQGFTPAPSFINVPVVMRTPVVQDLLNQQITGLLFQSDTLALGVVKPVKIKVWKGDSIQLGLEGDELSYRIPLKIWLQFSFTVGALGVSHTEYQDVEATLALKFRSRLFVKNDWSVATMTRADGYEWISDPVIKVRFLTVPVKPIGDLLLLTQQKSLAALIDKEVNNVLNIKNLLLPVWRQMQEPLQLAKDPPLWLRLTPRSVYMTQLQGRENTIRGSVGIQTIAETFVGEKPAVTTSDSLPDFIIPGSIDSNFVINLYGEMSYDAATTMLREYLMGRSFAAGRKEVIIEDVGIAGIDGYAVVSLQFFGSFKGKVYVIGRPVFDSATSTVSIEDLQYDLTTKSALQNAAGWLFQGIILTKIKPFLKFPLRERLLESQLMVQKMVCHSQLMQNVYITGAIDSLRVGGVRLTDRAIQAAVFASGSLTLTMHE